MREDGWKAPPCGEVGGGCNAGVFLGWERKRKKMRTKMKQNLDLIENRRLAARLCSVRFLCPELSDGHMRSLQRSGPRQVTWEKQRLKLEK